MRHTRFASIGGRCGGMTETAFDEFELLQKIGAQVMNIDESELLQAVAEAPEAAAAELLGDLRQRFSKISSSSPFGKCLCRLYAFRQYLRSP